MNIYELEKRFDPKTGEPVDPVFSFKERLCDYCGQTYYIEDSPYPFYCLDYDGMDTMYGAGGEEYQFGQDFEVDMHQFLSCNYSGGGGMYGICAHCEDEAMEEFTELVSEGMTNFGDFLRKCRVETARRLIEEDEIEPHQIAGYYGEWPE